MPGIEKTQSKAIDMGFLATDAGCKSVVIRIILISLTDMEQQRLVDQTIHTNFELWPQSDILENVLAEKVGSPPILTSRIKKINKGSRIGGTFRDQKLPVNRSRGLR